MTGADPLAPPRGPLLTEVEAAARTISPAVWGGPYRPGEGVMHHAGGGYWRSYLLRRAARWEHLAAAARICAAVLPRDDSARDTSEEPA